jgi:hypothetical protein
MLVPFLTCPINATSGWPQDIGQFVIEGVGSTGKSVSAGVILNPAGERLQDRAGRYARRE